MATVHGTKHTLNELIEKNAIVMIDFWAEWCGPCKRFAPTFEAASEKHKDVVFVKVDTEEQPELAGAFGIRSIPTLVIFRDQIPLLQEAGMLPPEALDELIEEVRALDMDDVKRQIAEHEKAAAKD